MVDLYKKMIESSLKGVKEFNYLEMCTFLLMVRNFFMLYLGIDAGGCIPNIGTIYDVAGKKLKDESELLSVCKLIIIGNMVVINPVVKETSECVKKVMAHTTELDKCLKDLLKKI